METASGAQNADWRGKMCETSFSCGRRQLGKIVVQFFGEKLRKNVVRLHCAVTSQFYQIEPISTLLFKDYVCRVAHG